MRPGCPEGCVVLNAEVQRFKAVGQQFILSAKHDKTIRLYTTNQYLTKPQDVLTTSPASKVLLVHINRPKNCRTVIILCQPRLLFDIVTFGKSMFNSYYHCDFAVFM